MNKKYILGLLITITLIGAFLRIFPVRYGSVRMYDNQLVSQALDLGEGIAKGDFSVFKTPVKYPYFFSYILLFFYGLFYVFGKLIGLFSSVGEFINYIYFHIDGFYDFARILIGIFGTLLIPLVYLVTFKIVSFKNKEKAGIAGLLAAFLMAFNLLHVHISHQERPHILVGFFIFLSFYLFILFLEKRSLIYSLFLGLSIGLAAGSLQVGLLALFFFFLIVIFTKFKTLLSFKFWLAILLFLMIFVISYPYIILSFKNVVGLWDNTFHVNISESEGLRKNLYFGQEIKQIFVYQPELICLFIIFLIFWLFLRHKTIESSPSLYRMSLWGAGSFILVYFLAFGFLVMPYHRMLASLIPFLCLLVGILFYEVFYKFNKKLFKEIFIIILVLFLLFPVIQDIRFCYLIFKKETVELARDWIKDNVSKEDVVAIEYDNIRLTPDKKSLQLQSNLEPGSLSRKENFLLSLDENLYPKDNRKILNYWIFQYKENRYQFLKEQKVKYFVISKSNPKEISRNGLESEIISKGGKLVKVFNPFVGETSSRHALFPAEFEDPIVDLWIFERLGQVIEIYKL